MLVVNSVSRPLGTHDPRCAVRTGTSQDIHCDVYGTATHPWDPDHPMNRPLGQAIGPASPRTRRILVAGGLLAGAWFLGDKIAKAMRAGRR